MKKEECVIGLLVIPDKNHENFNNWKYQYVNKDKSLSIGRIITLPDEDGWTKVRWNNNSEYIYPFSLLLPYQELSPEEQERSDKMYELPYLPGQRVCLNPEMENYKNVFRSINCDTGYVVKLEMNLSNLQYWSTFKDKQNHVIQVQFDNGKIYSLSLKSLLLIDTPPRTAHFYRLSNGCNFMYVDGNVEEPKVINRLNNEIINMGKHVSIYEKYDNEWRAKVTQDILNYSSNQNQTGTTTSSVFVIDEELQKICKIADDNWDFE